LDFYPFWQDKRLKVSDLVAICYFDDDVDGQPKEYAHINFNAHAGSKKILLFAELARIAEVRDP
jgi:hypothetical protein